MIFPITLPPTIDQISTIVEALTRGGVVLMPADTIYGLHAVATNDAAVERIAAMKGREDVKPFVVLGASVSQIETLGVAIPQDVRSVLDSLWPAPLTAILPLRAPVAASRGAATLAVRIPAPFWVRTL
ncbi:MAG TPA: Sua5/YciO/YrdC/YwlC family protein, partial [Thermoanaerobaculia bacterium]|nr:Sua5/YciO/YrdC/YwlC family protein [Thermoanaerobaculia bacterium]